MICLFKFLFNEFSSRSDFIISNWKTEFIASASLGTHKMSLIELVNIRDSISRSIIS
jgi:hypothetical protein